MSDELGEWKLRDKSEFGYSEPPYWYIQVGDAPVINLFTRPRNDHFNTHCCYQERSPPHNVIYIGDADIPAELRSDMDALKRYVITLWRMS
jgi:hypothetical protein